MKSNLAVWVLMVASTQLMAQTYTEKITKEISFEKRSIDNAIMIVNINGNIKVEGYSGDKILLEVTKSISAKTNERLEKGKTQIQLGIIDRADTILFFVEGTGAQFGKNPDKRHNNSWNRNGWGYNWCCNGNNNCNGDCNCRLEYDYKMDFVLKVPSSTHLLASTINDGNISIENVSGAVKADNINGSIRLNNLVREANASTINGDVDIEYSSNPKKDCRFYTLNGDINAWFQKGLAASMSFESFNGSFYTNIDNLETMPVQVEKKNVAEGVKYKVNGNRFKIGSGGALLDFETFNGNVYLKER
jgi:DUF4097 and DUF4098 domain-containing protein YvlB